MSKTLTMLLLGLVLLGAAVYGGRRWQASIDVAALRKQEVRDSLALAR